MNKKIQAYLNTGVKIYLDDRQKTAQPSTGLPVRICRNQDIFKLPSWINKLD